MALDKLVDSTALDGALTATANAIRAKGGTSAQIAFNASTGFSAAVAALPSGGGSVAVPANDVNFRDYDGTIVASYSAADFANLSALPPNPSHDGLTAQGWNWTLSAAKTHVAAYGRLEIGQMYITDDGKTRLYCRFAAGRLAPVLGICPNGTVVVDWGDGSAANTLTGTSLTTVKTAQHTYTAPGDYVITITVSNGTFAIAGASNECYLLRKSAGAGVLNMVYSNCIKKVEIGLNAVLSSYAFLYCCSMASITMPNSITAVGNNNLFQYCATLRGITLPFGTAYIGSYSFQNCSSLLSIAIPGSVTSIGDSAFEGAYSLDGITLPHGVTSIGNNAFATGYSLSSLKIPNSVTSIGNNAFGTCPSMASITLSSGLTQIGNSAFTSCTGLGEIHFLAATPPTVTNANAFTNVQTDCKIYVPAARLNAYKAATNYPNPSTYTYIGE